MRSDLCNLSSLALSLVELICLKCLDMRKFQALVFTFRDLNSIEGSKSRSEY